MAVRGRSFVTIPRVCYHSGIVYSHIIRRNSMAARILVVNDKQEILELFRTLLEEEGNEVILAGFPIQQISEIEQIKPDLIILDFVFVDQKTGWQMLQMLKMTRAPAAIPVLVCTA